MKRKIKKETIRCYSGEHKDGEYHIKKIFSSTTNDYDAEGILLSSVEHNYYENGDVSCINETSRSVEGDCFIYKTVGWRPNGFSIEKRDKQGNDGLSDEEPCTTTHYYSRDFMGNIVETAINEEGKHVESRLHDGVTRTLIERKEIGDIDERGSTIRAYATDGLEICGMFCHDELLNHYKLCYCEYDRDGNWIIRMTPRFLSVPKYYMEQSGWPQDYYIEIRDIEYLDSDSHYELFSDYSF